MLIFLFPQWKGWSRERLSGFLVQGQIAGGWQNCLLILCLRLFPPGRKRGFEVCETAFESRSGTYWKASLNSSASMERQRLSYRSEHLQVVWHRSFFKMQDLSQCTHSYYTRGSAEFLVLPPTSPRFTVLCRKGLNGNSFHPSHFIPSLLSGFLLNHWVVDSEWLLKDYPRQGKSPPGRPVTVENELLIPAALTKQSEVRPKLLTNSINSKVAKVTFNLIFPSFTQRRPWNCESCPSFSPSNIKLLPWGNMGLALLETLGIKILQGIQNLNVSQTCAINGISLGWQRNAKEKCGHSEA